MFDKLDPFVHRPRTCGFYDSICTSCAATVGSQMGEAELESLEKDHVCDPEAVTRWAESLERFHTTVRR